MVSHSLSHSVSIAYVYTVLVMPKEHFVFDMFLLNRIISVSCAQQHKFKLYAEILKYVTINMKIV